MHLSTFLIPCLALAVSGQRLSFIALDDWGAGGIEQREVADAMNQWAQTYNPQFILTAGDNFYDGGIEGLDDPRWQTNWNEIYTGDKIRNLTWQVSIGNHGYRPAGTGNEWYQVEYSSVDSRWKFPNLYHSFYADSPLGPIHFINGDSQAFRKDRNDPDAQLSWLQFQLQNSRGVMKIVTMHHPIYSTGSNGPGDTTIQDQILPVLEQYNVDLYICGHDHNMQFLRYVSGSPALEFIITGGGGRSVSRQRTELIDILRRVYGVYSSFYYTNGFVGITVEDGSDEMRIQYRDQDNVLILDLRKKPGQPSVAVPV